MSAAIASCAARLISAGAGKSGKPCERLTALYCKARRVISRITDSVNCDAFAESCALAITARSGWAGFIWFLCPVNFAVDARIARDDLYIFARLSKRNRVNELSNLAVILSRVPLRDALFTRIVRGQRRFHTSEIVFQAG